MSCFSERAPSSISGDMSVGGMGSSAHGQRSATDTQHAETM